MIRVLVVDDHCEMRARVKALLGEYPDVEIVGEAEDGRAAIELAKILKPDVILMDISMPRMNGIEAMRIIIREKSSIRIIILSTHANKRFIDSAINGGAAGYVLKSHLFEDLYNAVRAAMADDLFISPQTGVVISDYTKRPPEPEEHG